MMASSDCFIALHRDLQGDSGGRAIGLVDFNLRFKTMYSAWGVVAKVAAHQPGELPDPMSKQPCCQTLQTTISTLWSSYCRG